MKTFITIVITLLSTINLVASDICQAFKTPLQTRTEASTINFSPNGGASYLYGSENTFLDTSMVINKQVGWWPFSSYDKSCKEMNGISDAPCAASKNLGKAIDLEDVRAVTKHSTVATVSSNNNAKYDNYGQGLTSEAVLNLPTYNTIQSGWYPDLQMNIEIAQSLHVNNLSTPSSSSRLNFKGTSAYDVFVNTLNLDNKTTTKFDYFLQTLKVNTLSMNIENQLNIEASKEVSIGALKISPSSSLLIKTPKLIIDSLNESASSTPNTLNLIADSIDISTLNLADNTIFSIAPFSKSDVTVTIGSLKSGSRTQIKLGKGDYHVDSLLTNGSNGEATINTDGFVTMLLGSDLNLLSGNSLNFTKEATNLLLIVKGNVNLQSNTKTAAMIYAQGDIALQSGAILKGAMSAKSSINLYHDAKVYASACQSPNTGIDLVSLNIKIEKNELKEQTTTPLQINATYSDGTIKEITDNINWDIQDNSIISIDNNTLKALKEGTTTLSATVDNHTSNTISITVYKEINGYKLPPEPDPTINNSTILGIDSNNNGVRDDVERKIFATYDKAIEQAYMMQGAKKYQKYLENPVGIAESGEAQQDTWNQYSCLGYLEEFENIEIPRSAKFFNEAYMNTKERIRAYIEFNEAMSGGSYPIPMHDKDLKKENCDFDVDAMLEMDK